VDPSCDPRPSPDFARPRASLPRVALAVLATLNLGCASYQGSAKPARMDVVVSNPNWVMIPNFPRVLQTGTHDCGAAVLAAVLEYWGKPTTPDRVAGAEGKHGKRLSASELERHARKSGLSSFVFYGNLGDLMHEVRRGRPVIVGVGKPIGEDKAIAHYEVVIGFDPQQKRVLLLDPAVGFVTNSYEGFGKEWAASKGVTIVAFLSESQRKAVNP
jgi:predicted double-glycine peptidase